MIFEALVDEFFVGRKDELGLLKRDECMAFYGPNRIGKTWLFKKYIKYAEEVCVYLDLDKLDLIPELFSKEIVGLCIKALNKSKLSNDKFFDIENLKRFKYGDKAEFAFLKIKAEKDREKKIRIAFDFIVELKKIIKKNIKIFIERFEFCNEIHKRFLEIVIEYIEKYGLCFVVSCSSLTEFSNIFKGKLKRLFDLFTIKELPYKEAKELMRKIVKRKLKEQECKKLYKFVRGHPYYLTKICETFKQVNNVEESFLLEVLKFDGRIYEFCKSKLDSFIGKSCLYKSIIFVVSRNPGITIRGVADSLDKDYNVINVYIHRLLGDVLVMRNGSLYLYDLIFTIWLNYFYKDIEVGPKEMNEIKAHYYKNEI